MKTKKSDNGAVRRQHDADLERLDASTREARRNRGNDRHDALDAAVPETTMDWGHYVESRLHDFEERW